jgi:hypothetical protein
MATKTYDSLAYTVLGAPAASITFSSISGAYTDLRLVLSGTCTANVSLILQFNGDTATNYSYRYMNGNGVGVGSSSGQSTTNVILAGFNTDLTKIFMCEVDILQYKNTGMFKDFLNKMANDRNGSGEINTTIGLWRSTSAITSVVISTNSSTLATGFTAELIGIL